MMMMKKKKETSTSAMTVSSDHQCSPKSRRPRSREVSSRFLSPTSTTSSVDNGGLPSPNRSFSPSKRKAASSSSSTTTGFSSRKHQSAEDINSIRGLWPASNSSGSKKLGTLADHLGNDSLKDLLERDINGGAADPLPSRQRSSSEFGRFIGREDNTKENHRPLFGGSARYTGKSNFLSSNNSSNSSVQPQGRFSADQNIHLFRKTSSRRTSDSFSDAISSESECSDLFSSTDSPAMGKNYSFSSSSNLSTSSSSLKMNSQRSGMEVSSRYMRPSNHRGSSDSNISLTAATTTNFASSENFQNPSSLLSKTVISRAKSMRVNGTVMSQWALSPGRSSSPPFMLVENKGKRVMSFSKLKPPNSPPKSKGVGNLLNMGLELFKSKTKSSSSAPSSSLTGGHGLGEDAHQLRLLHCRLLQWRYANAHAMAVDARKKALAESSLLNALARLYELQLSTGQKRVNFNKEKLQLKLNNILCSQVPPLEAWGDMERQHVSAVSMTIDCLHSVVCRVPLIEGAKVDPQLASVAIRNADDLTASVKTMLTDFSPSAQKAASLLSELAQVVSREKSLLQECFELLELVSALEMQEKSLKCSLIQLKSQHPQHSQQRSQQQEEIVL